MDETDEDEYWQLQQGLWDSRVQESMRGRQKVRTNPSQEDRKVRRRNRRATAGGDVEKRAELVRALSSRTLNFSEQAVLLDQIRQIDENLSAMAAQGREIDFANAVVRETLSPVRVHEHHTAATDWLGDASAVDPQWQNRVVAEAAMWFGRVPDFVKQDAQEFGIQAQGKARQLAGQFGLQAQAAQKTFVDYVSFLHKQSASGLDQIQQTVDPHDNPKETPLNPEVFDNFAPEVDPINAGVSGTEDSNRNPLLQEILQGGSGGDPGAPEKPGGHSEGNELSWNPPEGMQQDSTPPLDYAQGPSDQEPDAPDNRMKQSSRYDGRSPAIGYTMNMDEFRAREASRKAGGQGKGRKESAWPFNRKQQAPAATPAAPAQHMDPDLGIPYGHPGSAERTNWILRNSDREDAEDRILNHQLQGCPDGCPGGPYHGMESAKPRLSRLLERQAASGLDQIQQTVDPHDNPKETGLPPEVAFPLDDEFQQEWSTNGTGNAAPGQAQAAKKASHGCSDCGGTISSGKCKKCGQECSCGQCKKSKGKVGNFDGPADGVHTKSASRKQADQWGSSDAPHPVVQPNVANTPQTTPPTLDQASQEAGAADAEAGNMPSFSDLPLTPQYSQGYTSVDPSAGVPRDVPGSVAGPGKGVTHAGSSKVSSLIVTAAERENADFKKGYGYGLKWTPGARLVSTGSKEFEAGVYAGISDNPEHQRAFVEAHRSAGEQFPALAARAAQHKRVTARVVAKNEVPSNGLYLTASTSLDLATTAPNTTPAADGSTPINGPGRPGPLDGQQDAAAPGGPSPYNGAEPFGSPVVPGVGQSPANPADALIGGGHMSTPNQVMAKQALTFRQRVQAGLLAERQGK